MSRDTRIDRRRLLLAAAGGSMVLGRSQAFAQAPAALRVGEGTVPDYTHFYIADKLDLWSRNRLAATSTMFPAGRLAVDALLAGKVYIATSAETPVMFAAVSGLPIEVIATVITYQPFDLVAGPAIRDLGDLAGKRIAFAQGTNAHFYLDSLVRSRGLTWQDVTAINMTIGNFVPSLVSGAVDGFVWSEPLISAALKQGGQFRRLHAEGLYFTYGCVSALRTTIEKRPDVLACALKSVMAADEIIKTDPAQAQKILSDTLKLDPATPATFWSDLNFEVTMDKARLVRDLQRQAQWAVDNKLTKPGAALPDFAAIVTDEIYGRARAA